MNKLKSKIFFIRIFIIFLSLGILTTWSRAANFSYILILLSFLFYSKINFKKYINPLINNNYFILIFDVFVMTLFFGNARLVERLVEDQLSRCYLTSRMRFGLSNLKIFGYLVMVMGLLSKYLNFFIYCQKYIITII